MSILLLKPELPPTTEQEMLAWVRRGVRLERPEQSVRHRIEAAARDKAVDDFTNGFAYEFADMFKDAQSFVIQNDWASAFRGAGDFDTGAVHLPYPKTVFEFRVSGRAVLLLAEEQPELGSVITVLPFIEGPSGWTLAHDIYMLTDDLGGSVFLDHTDPRYLPLTKTVTEQARAVCICLEAGVSETDTIAAPARLNKAREKRGQVPLADYRVVRLGRRHQAGDGASGEGTRKRLHFRRGHLRHYEDKAIWIKWMLVGDPDLGFVNKEYRL